MKRGRNPNWSLSESNLNEYDPPEFSNSDFQLRAKRMEKWIKKIRCTAAALLKKEMVNILKNSAGNPSVMSRGYTMIADVSGLLERLCRTEMTLTSFECMLLREMLEYKTKYGTPVPHDYYKRKLGFELSILDEVIQFLTAKGFPTFNVSRRPYGNIYVQILHDEEATSPILLRNDDDGPRAARQEIGVPVLDGPVHYPGRYAPGIPVPASPGRYAPESPGAAPESPGR